MILPVFFPGIWVSELGALLLGLDYVSGREGLHLLTFLLTTARNPSKVMLFDPCVSRLDHKNGEI